MIQLPLIERTSKAELEAFQLQEVKKTLEYVQQYSPYYKAQWKQLGVSASSILSWSDFQKLPFTTKQDLQEHNDEFLCVTKKEVIDWVTTSGTMGRPVTFALSKQDIDRLGYNEALSFVRCGVEPSDIIQIATTIDKRFMAGLAYYEGAKMIGAGVIRMGPGAIGLQWESIQRFGTTVLIGVPSFIFKMKQFAIDHGIDLVKTSIQKIICIGEPIRNRTLQWNHLGKRLKENWTVELYGTYASTEMSTAFTECSFGQGGHCPPELSFIEVFKRRK